MILIRCVSMAMGIATLIVGMALLARAESPLHQGTKETPLIGGTVQAGLALEYAEQGAADGPTIILLHGFPDSWRAYKPLMAAIPARFRVIAVSQRGFGGSEHPEDGYNVKQLADDLATFMKVMRIERAVIVGHSMGALVASRFGADYPAKTDGLVLIGMFRTLKDDPAVDAFWRDELSPLQDPIDPALVRAFQESTVARPMLPGLMDMLVAESLKAPARVWKTMFSSLMHEDFAQTVRAVQAPVFYYWGSEDIFAPEAQRKALVAATRTSSFKVEAGAGHSPHWEEPQGVARSITDFVEAIATN